MAHFKSLFLRRCRRYPNTDAANHDKTFAHAYLAAMDDPVARVGEGARQGVWDFESEAFSGLTGFLRDLAAIGR